MYPVRRLPHFSARHGKREIATLALTPLVLEQRWSCHFDPYGDDLGRIAFWFIGGVGDPIEPFVCTSLGLDLPITLAALIGDEPDRVAGLLDNLGMKPDDVIELIPAGTYPVDDQLAGADRWYAELANREPPANIRMAEIDIQLGRLGLAAHRLGLAALDGSPDALYLIADLLRCENEANPAWVALARVAAAAGSGVAGGAVEGLQRWWPHVEAGG
ncbi:MAG: hypothetical protein ABMA25_11935 [Ilumatobacteraceae bacterium]